MKRKQQPINSSSMADIGFLLLIFFLVTTTMKIDAGILCVLPPLDTEPITTSIHKKEVLEILINQEDKLLVENTVTQVEVLRYEVVKHLENEGALANYSSNPRKAVVSIQNKAGTSYNAYIQVYNEIRAGYNTVRNNVAREKYGKDMKALNDQQLNALKKEIPMRISEAEYTD